MLNGECLISGSSPPIKHSTLSIEHCWFMAQLFTVHPENPQPRLIRQAAETLRAGGVIVYPTDSCYALGCRIGDKSAMERIRAIRRVDARHHFALVCRDLAEIALYAR